MPWLSSRVARIGIPAAVVAALGTGLTVAVWPDAPAVTAEPAPAASVAAPSSAAPSASGTPRTQDGISREMTRPELRSLADSPSAEASGKSSEKDTEKASTKDDDKAPAQDEEKAEPKSGDSGQDEGKADRQDEQSEEADAKSEEKAEQEADEETAPEPDLDVTGSRYTTVDLNVRTGPDESSDVVTVLGTGSKVKITDTRADGFRQVVYQDQPRWVANEYLSKKKPEVSSDGEGGSSGGISSAPCPSGSSVEDGLTPDAVLVHRAICHAFPQVDTFGGVRASNDYHGTGQAVDAMISDQQTGEEIAHWVRAHADELGVSEVIHAQKIWTVQRSSEGWRYMPDRGSVSANHYDHVHVSVYGNSADG